MSDTKKKGLLPMTAIFLTVMLDLLSFGLVIPDIQNRGRELIKAASLPIWLDQGLLLGFLMALFSLTQFIVSPFFGHLSDRVGRRPILLATCMLAVLSSLVYSQATVLWIMIIARILQGAGGGNLGVAYAYVSDVSSQEERAKMMGRLGAAFGIGFMFGPPTGAWLIELGHHQPFILGLVSAGMAMINFLFILFFLPESVHDSKIGAEAKPRVKIGEALRIPGLGVLLALFFVGNFAFSNLESTFFLLAHDRWGLSEFLASFVLVLVGVTQAATQGLLVPRVIPKLGELNTLRLAYAVQSPMMCFIPFSSPWLTLLGGCFLMSMAGGLGQPSMSSLISKAAPKEMSGSVFGVMQSLGALARIIGPFVGNFLYARWNALPYIVASVLLLLPLFGTILVGKSVEVSEPGV